MTRSKDGSFARKKDSRWLSLICITALIGLSGCLDPQEEAVNETCPDCNRPANVDECGGALVHGQYIVQWKNGDITVEHQNDNMTFVNEFLKPQISQIQHVELNRTFNIYQDLETKSSIDPEVNWGFDQVGAAEAHEKGITGQNTLVAVIDSGVEIEHPQLMNHVFTNTKEAEGIEGVDDDGNGYIDDVHGYDFFRKGSPEMTDPNGHGTHVAGIIAADHEVGNVKGVAPDTEILPLKFMNEYGEGDLLGAIKAIEYASDMGADVINASWGGEFCSVVLKKQIESLTAKNVLFVAAAGNSGKDLDINNFPEYPAAFIIDSQLVVGATTPSDRVVSFSNIGARFVNLLAPGYAITSTYPGFDTKTQSGLELSLDGTSMAAPFVAGAAALLLSAYPQAQYHHLKKALLGGVSSSPDSGFPYPVSSGGRLNITSALDQLSREFNE